MSIFGDAARAVGRWFSGRQQAPKEELSPRYKRLLELEQLYWGQQYEHRGLQPSWDKLTPGRYVPLRAQKPSTQYDLPRLIVDRPTALLFGEGRFPELSFSPLESGVDVSDVNAWLAAISEEGDLPHVMLTAARQGGALGTAVVTWQVVEGEFDFEPHLAMFCRPTFHPKKRRKLIALEKRYKFKKEVEEQTSTGIQYREREFYHRETWDETSHIVYVDALVPPDGSEPFWQIADQVDHGFGRCPAAWIKNLDDADPSEIDGISLLEGLGDLTEDIDRTLSQKSRAVRYNQDPERVYFGLDEQSANRLKVGGGATTLLPAKPAGDLAIMELKGDGQRIAEEHVVSQRDRALETARVVSPNPDRLLSAAKSGVALRMLFAPMLELVGELRSTYGRGLRDLLCQICDVARDGKLTAIGELDSPPPEVIPDGSPRLTWGSYFDPTPDDINQMATAIGALAKSELYDRETLIRMSAPYFGIQDVNHVLEKAEAERNERDKKTAAQLAQVGADQADTGDDAANMDDGAAGTEAVDAVYQQLVDDFEPDAIDWVKQSEWSGPEDVPLSKIDFSQKASWRASGHQAKVDRFAKKIQGGFKKPVILIQPPGGGKYRVADGHHRALAYQKLGQPVHAYVATVDKDGFAKALEMHSAQKVQS